MNKTSVKAVCWIATGIFLPSWLHAQSTADSIHSLQAVLDQLYEDMLPLCSRLIGVGRGIAGFAATWYIAARVWRHIANAEPVDFYPLFRPFVIGFAVMIFPSVIAMINGVMKPTVTATAAMVTDSDKAIAVLLKQKEDAIKKTAAWQMYVGETGSGDRDKWCKYTHPDDKTGDSEGWIESVGNDVKFSMAKASYNFRNSIKEWMSEILKVLYEAAALCINTMRTFNLLVLAILGPLVFGLSVFDGFQHTLTVWLARYINIFLWLPVANIFGSIIAKIQENMLKVDISQVQSAGDTFFSSTDTAYLVFMLIGIVGYFTVPSIANYIVHAGGGNALLYRVSSMFSGGSSSVIQAGGSTGSMTASAFGSAAARMGEGLANVGQSAGYFREGYSGSHPGAGTSAEAGRQAGKTGAYLYDKLKGNS
ncbi:MAG: conjugative transposon protein TraJ [Williamsia sp.]|nr:conjugative transposon protein TraJ [Williamsia sp.]